MKDTLFKSIWKQFENFSDAADHYMNLIQSAYESNKLHQLVEDNMRKDSGLKMFSNSLYSVHLSRWLAEFDRFVLSIFWPFYDSLIKWSITTPRWRDSVQKSSSRNITSWTVPRHFSRVRPKELCARVSNLVLINAKRNFPCIKLLFISVIHRIHSTV